MAKKKKAKARDTGFAVVPEGFSGSGAPAPAGAAKPHSKVGPNTLRNAHSNSRKGASAAERKTNEIWFRKCGHGERLFGDYYGAQPGVVPADEWDDFQAALGTPLPVTFRLHGPTQGGGGRDGEAQGYALALLREELEKVCAYARARAQPCPGACLCLPALRRQRRRSCGSACLRTQTHACARTGPCKAAPLGGARRVGSKDRGHLPGEVSIRLVPANTFFFSK
jgi:hypothetical protein